MAQGGPAVTILTSGGIPVVQVSGGGSPFTVVAEGGFPVTLVDFLGIPVALYNEDGTDYTVFSLTAPVLSIESGVGVDIPVLKLIVDDDIPSGYKVRIAASVNSNMSSPFETILNPILTADLTDGQIDSDTPGYDEFAPMTSGAKYFQAVLLTDLDAQASGYSNIPTITLVISSFTPTFHIYGF